ncbi:Ubiquitin carboxyl-terminal hydrolase 21 [Orobanche hederae]
MTFVEKEGGLHNFGHTCYINCIIQCLAHSRTFSTNVIQNTAPLKCKCENSFCLKEWLGQIFVELISKEEVVKLNLDDLKNLLNELSKQKEKVYEKYMIDKAGTAEGFLYDLLHILAAECDKSEDGDIYIIRLFLGSLALQRSVNVVNPYQHHILSLHIVHGDILERNNNFEYAVGEMWKNLMVQCDCKLAYRELAKISIQPKYMVFVNDEFPENFTPPMSLGVSPYATKKALVFHVKGEVKQVKGKVKREECHFYTVVQVLDHVWFKYDDDKPVAEEDIFKTDNEPSLLYYAREGAQWSCIGARDLNGF